LIPGIGVMPEVRRSYMKEIIGGLLEKIAVNGGKGAVVPVERFYELKGELDSLKTEKYHAFSDWLGNNMAIPDDFNFKPRSLICVIVPSPRVMIEVNYHGESIQCIVPPQYLDANHRDNEFLQYINDYLEPFGYKAAFFDKLPQKLLAVHCGLGRYGRNNICYNEEYGSYIRILSYISDLPCEEAPWFPARRMDICEKCQACINACPTKAIDPDSRIVNALVCLTALNEDPRELPDWVDANAHNALIGCMKCQDCCPGNIHNKDNVVRGITFSEEETNELIMHKDKDNEPFSDSLDAKLRNEGFQPWFLKVLPRNLRVLLKI